MSGSATTAASSGPRLPKRATEAQLRSPVAFALPAFPTFTRPSSALCWSIWHSRCVFRSRPGGPAVSPETSCLCNAASTCNNGKLMLCTTPACTDLHVLHGLAIPEEARELPEYEGTVCWRYVEPAYSPMPMRPGVTVGRSAVIPLLGIYKC